MVTINNYNSFTKRDHNSAESDNNDCFSDISIGYLKSKLKEHNLMEHFDEYRDKIFSPQGLSFSHEIKVPVVENTMNAINNFMDLDRGKMGNKTLGDLLRVFQPSNPDPDSNFGFYNLYFWYFVLFALSYARLRVDTNDTSESNLRYRKMLINYTLVASAIVLTLWFIDDLFVNDDNFHRDLYNRIFEDDFQMLRETYREDVDMVPVFNAQSHSDNINYLTKLVLACFSLCVGYKVKDNFAHAFLNYTKINKVQTDNVADMISTASNFVSEVLNKVGATNFSEYFHIEAITDPEIKIFDDKVKDFMSSINAADVYNSAFISHVYSELLTSGEGLLKKTKDSYEQKLLTENIKELRKSELTINTLRKSLGGNRIEPVGIYIYGSPGCMKTVLCERLVYIVSKMTLPESWESDFDRNPKDFQFALPKDKFFEGYNYKKWSVIIDDVFQCRDTPGDPESEALKVINMINTAEYVVPMAQIEKKNSVFFRSPFVYATSNMSSFEHLESIRDVKSVERRFNVRLEIKVNEKYLKKDGKTVDFNKLPLLEFRSYNTIDELNKNVEDNIDGTSIPDDFWRIKVIEFDGNSKSEPRIVSLEEAADLIIMKHHNRIRNYYINRFQEKNLYNSSLVSLKEKYQRNKGIYSSMAYKTYTPSILTAQAGSSSSSPSLYEDTQDRIYNFKESWKVVPSTTKVLVMARFLTEINFYGLSDLHKNFENNFLDYFDTVDANEHKLCVVLLEECNVPQLIYRVVSDMRNRERVFMHPVTKKPFTFPKTVLAYYESFKKKLNYVVNFIKKNIKFILISSIILSTIIPRVVDAIISFFKTTKSPVAQSVDLKMDRHRVGRYNINLKKDLEKIALRPQAPKMTMFEYVIPDIEYREVLGFKNNMSDVVERVLKKYFFIIYLVIKDEEGEIKYIRYGHAWNIKGQIFMMPLHFLYKLHDIHRAENYKGATLLFTTTTKHTKYVCNLEDIFNTFKVSEDSARNDCVLFYLPGANINSIGMFKYIAKMEDVQKLRKSSSFKTCVYGTSLSKETNGCIFRINHSSARFQSEVDVRADWDEQPSSYKLEDVIMYEGSFMSGDCGSMLVVNENQFQNRVIFGMHVAGETNFGVSSMVVQEYLDLLIESEFGQQYIFDQEEETNRSVPLAFTAQGPMLPVGELTPGNTMSSPNTTTLTKSKLFGRLPEPFREVKHFPALLFTKVKANGEVINPGEQAINKYKRTPVPFENEVLLLAVASYESLITEHMQTPRSERCTIPLKEALHPFRSVRGIASSTSAGFPMCLTGEENLKKLYFDAYNDNDTEKIIEYYERIAKLVCDRIQMYLNGIRPEIFYKDCLKEEKVKREKALLGLSRLFAACEFILLAMFRMYFGAFMSAFIDANIKVGSGIGINPYSKDWDKLARELMKFSVSTEEQSIGAGDYKAFDTSEFPQVLNQILQIINRWYGPNHPDNIIRIGLWAEITNSKHIWENKTYTWVTGMPPGNPLTSLINTMYNNLVFRMCFGGLGLPIVIFNKTVTVVVVGDDNVFSCSPMIRDRFNEMTLVDVMAKLGLTYTTEFKGVAETPFRKITEVEFLKRGFRKDNNLNRWVAPLRLESIFATLNWTRKGIYGDQITVDEISSAFSELSLHGRKTFDEYSIKLLDLKQEFLPNHHPSKSLSLDYYFVYHDTLKNEYEYKI